MRLLLACVLSFGPVLVISAPQYRQRLGSQQGAARNRGRGRGGGGGRGYGRRRPPPVIEYDDGTDYDDGDSYDRYNSVEDRRYGVGRGRGEYDNREYSRTTERVVEAPRRPEVSEPEKTKEEDKDGCGSECRNLLHELDHRKEDNICPYEGMVLDIYGYCRYIHEHERRDWAWWESVRNYIYGMGNSWSNSYSPTVHQQMYHAG